MAILRIKKIMTEKDISRKELAKRIGVSVATISNITTEETLPSVTLLVKIASALDCDIRDLFNPTKGNSVTQDEINAAKSLIAKGLEILEGR